MPEKAEYPIVVRTCALEQDIYECLLPLLSDASPWKCHTLTSQRLRFCFVCFALFFSRLRLWDLGFLEGLEDLIPLNQKELDFKQELTATFYEYNEMAARFSLLSEWDQSV